MLTSHLTSPCQKILSMGGKKKYFTSNSSMGGKKKHFTSNSSFEECSYFKTLKTVVRDLGWGTDALVVARAAVGFFTGYNAHHQIMFTHFSHILVDESDNDWVVERTEHDVIFQKITKQE